MIALSLSSCGGGDAAGSADVTVAAPPPATTTAPPSAPPAAPSASVPPAPVTPATTTPSATTSSAPTVAAAPPATDRPRAPAAFTVAAHRVAPVQIIVPPGLAVELQLRAADARAHRLELRTARPRTFAVPAHGTATTLIDGLPQGTYAIIVDGGARAGTLRVAADAVGP